MNSIGLTILVSLILIILLMPRRWAVLGFISGVIYLTRGQQLDIGGFNFFAMRFIEIAGIIRLFTRRELSLVKINIIDRSFVIFQSVYFLVFLIRSIVDPSFIETLTYRIGYFLDGVISYVIFRVLLNNPDEFKDFLKKYSVLIIPFAVFMLVESVTGKNLFYFMGGVPEIPIIRDGYYRSQASFGGPITAGSFGATMLPFFIYLMCLPNGILWGFIGTIACLTITIASHSSGPLLGLVSGISAWTFWTFRTRMRIVRWWLVIAFILLHVIMNAPIWFIFNRISEVIGGDGWHRSNLIDQFITHVRDWWLMGLSLERTGSWAATRLENGAMDITNEFVSLGISGGLITLFLFIILLIKSYQSLGESMKVVRNDIANSKQNELLLWGIGCALFTHIITLTAVRYWDQMIVIWYMTLAVVSGITDYYLKTYNKNEQVINIHSGREVLWKKWTPKWHY